MQRAAAALKSTRATSSVTPAGKETFVKYCSEKSGSARNSVAVPVRFLHCLTSGGVLTLSAFGLFCNAICDPTLFCSPRSQSSVLRNAGSPRVLHVRRSHRTHRGVVGPAACGPLQVRRHADPQMSTTAVKARQKRLLAAVENAFASRPAGIRLDRTKTHVKAVDRTAAKPWLTTVIQGHVVVPANTTLQEVAAIALTALDIELRKCSLTFRQAAKFTVDQVLTDAKVNGPLATMTALQLARSCSTANAG